MAAELMPCAAPRDAETPRAEALGVALEMARAYKSMAEFYRREMKDEAGAPITTAAACGMVESHRAQLVEDIKNRLESEPKHISWHDLETLAREGDELPYQAWQEIKAVALDHHRQGVPMIEASESLYGQRPYERAQMIALRHELRRDWQPQSGIEAAIIDQMALAHWQYFQWINRLTVLENMHDRHLRREQGEATLPRVNQAQASDTAAAMADRFNRVFLRCVRSLRDLRRYPVTVNAPGAQVNIGEKQVNIAPAAGPSNGT
jgi:hypothetical protein